MMRPYRLLVLSSHPIQYQAPMHRALASRSDLDLTVLFCSDWGLTSAVCEPDVTKPFGADRRVPATGSIARTPAGRGM